MWILFCNYHKRCYAFESTIGFAFAASVCFAFPITVFKSELFATTADVGGNTSLAKRRVGDRKVANPWSIPKLAMCRVLGKDTSRVFPIGVDRPSCLPVVVVQLTKYLQTEPNKVLCVRVVRQTWSALFMPMKELRNVFRCCCCCSFFWSCFCAVSFVVFAFHTLLILLIKIQGDLKN